MISNINVPDADTDTLRQPILIATGNAGKVREIVDHFRGTGIEFLGLGDFPDVTDVDETGSTFAENASLKAAGYARQTGLCALADDSGLEIDALDGRPGVLSARYGGDELPFADKMQLLLSEMEKSPNRSRAARFVCVMAFADERGNIRHTAVGECRGTIASNPRGNGGFGYDPIFIPDSHERTFGELPAAVKAEISHRSRAADEIMRYLLDFIGILT